MEMESELESLLARFPELKLQTEKGMVVCSLSRHEMPSRVEVVRAYVGGKKFKTLKAEKDFNFERLQPYIFPSQKRKKQLFCALTNRYINRKPAEVELHLKGRRYKRALENYNSGTLSLFEERLGKRQRAENTAAEGREVEMEEEVDSDKDEEEKEVDFEPSPVMTTKPTRAVAGRGRKRPAVVRSSPLPVTKWRREATSQLRGRKVKVKTQTKVIS